MFPEVGIPDVSIRDIANTRDPILSEVLTFDGLLKKPMLKLWSNYEFSLDVRNFMRVVEVAVEHYPEGHLNAHASNFVERIRGAKWQESHFELPPMSMAGCLSGMVLNLLNIDFIAPFPGNNPTPIENSAKLLGESFNFSLRQNAAGRVFVDINDHYIDAKKFFLIAEAVLASEEFASPNADQPDPREQYVARICSNS